MSMPTVLNRLPPSSELNELHVLETGSVALPREPAYVRFRFSACELVFSAMTRPTDAGPVLQVAAHVAGDPYSAEGAAMRRAAHAIVRASHASPSCRLVVSTRKRIYCLGKAHLGEDWTPTALLAGAVELVLEARPYLLMLRDILPRWATPAI